MRRKELILFVCLGIVLALLVGIPTGLYYRNDNVHDFRINIIHKCYVYTKAHPKEEWAFNWCYYKLPSYDDMLFSFKPLTEEAWFTPEMIRRFKYGHLTIAERLSHVRNSINNYAYLRSRTGNFQCLYGAPIVQGLQS